MVNKIRSLISKFGKSLLLLGLVLTIALSHPAQADAAYSGGRMGGGSFRMPSRSYSAPRTYSAPRGGGYGGYGGGYGGGMGFPFLLPFLGFGGGAGGLVSILIFIAVANFLVQSFRKISGGDNEEGAILGGGAESQISVAKVQVGLLANARNLQTELNQLANTADTSTASGRAQMLQETTLAILRHPEYWAYGTSDSQKTSLLAAEAKFNQLALGERSKFAAETLSNYNSQLKQATLPMPETGGELTNLMATPGEYIVVTLLVGSQGKLDLPKINGAEDLRQALRQIGAVGSDRLLAVEILWTPQATGDTLTTDDVMAAYPDFKVL